MRSTIANRFTVDLYEWGVDNRVYLRDVPYHSIRFEERDKIEAQAREAAVWLKKHRYYTIGKAPIKNNE